MRLYVCRIGKSSGYKTSELLTLVEGHSLSVGGKEIEVGTTHLFILIVKTYLRSHLN